MRRRPFTLWIPTTETWLRAASGGRALNTQLWAAAVPGHFLRTRFHESKALKEEGIIRVDVIKDEGDA